MDIHQHASCISLVVMAMSGAATSSETKLNYWGYYDYSVLTTQNYEHSRISVLGAGLDINDYFAVKAGAGVSSTHKSMLDLTGKLKYPITQNLDQVSEFGLTFGENSKHLSIGMEYSFNPNWTISSNYTIYDFSSHIDSLSGFTFGIQYRFSNDYYSSIQFPYHTPEPPLFVKEEQLDITTNRMSTKSVLPEPTYTIKPDDTLSSIARKLDLHFYTLYCLNQDLFPDNDPNKVYPGQVLKLTKPAKHITVRHGDSIESLSTMSGLTIIELYNKNSCLKHRAGGIIYPKELIKI